MRGLSRMIEAVHYKSIKCKGPVINPKMGAGRSDFDTFSAECQACGAVFGHLTVEKPDPKSLSLGCLLAGTTFDHVEMSHQLADVQSPSGRTLQRGIEEAVVAVDEVFTEEFKELRGRVKNEPGRKTVEIPIEKHYLASNFAKFEELSKKGIGVKVDVEVGLGWW